MCGKFHTPLRMVHVLVAIFGGACAQQQKYWRFSPKMAVLRQKQAKWGQSKWLLHTNLQTFFDEVIIFGLVGDEVKMFRKTYLGACAPQQKNW